MTEPLGILKTASTSTLFEIDRSPVTLLDLLRVAFILAIAWWVSRMVRHGLQRITRYRTGVSPSSFYALGRVLHYLILLVGLLIGLGTIGISFRNFAIIAGALGVGIGFGLQGIVNNFVAGLIILFEKSLKVNDFVELASGVVGRVREINFRSTRVTTNDNIDILVPNAEFVTGRVTNWTLDEEYRRIHVPFGVAYGSDKELVREAATMAAKGIDNTVLDDARHPIEVWLVGFGDSSLNFELVVWIGHDLMTRPDRTKALFLWAIETELRKRGIEIPFPQRDLHVRSGTLNVAITHPDDPQEA